MSYFRYDPVVYALENEYRVVFITSSPGFGWVTVCGKRYYDAVCGVVRSKSSVHSVALPACVLDKAGEYTVGYRVMEERRPYFPVCGTEEEKTYCFHSVNSSCGFYALVLADMHGADALFASLCAERNVDFLVLNGDISDCCNTKENAEHIIAVASAVMHGEGPCVFVRGNHDLRGTEAESLCEYTPLYNGNTYYIVRLGNILLTVLDCGEDKTDSCGEYGGTASYGFFRERETEWLERTSRSGVYENNEVKYSIALCHMPFNEDLGREDRQFSIGSEFYSKWVEYLNGKITLLCCGHKHRTYFTSPGDEFDIYGQRFLCAVGSVPVREEDGKKFYTAMSLLGNPDGTVTVRFVRSDGKCVQCKTTKEGLK